MGGAVPGGGTINVEFQFYLIFLPLIGLIFVNRRLLFLLVSILLWAAGGALVVLYFSRVYPGVEKYVVNNAIYYSLALQLPYFVSGILFFDLLERRRISLEPPWKLPSTSLFWLGLLLLVPVQFLPSAILQLYAALPAFLLIFYGSRHLSHTSPLFRFVEFIGQVSYSFYFVHFMWLHTVGERLLPWVNYAPGHWALYVLFSVPACLAISAMTFKYIERPFINLAGKIVYRLNGERHTKAQVGAGNSYP